MDTRLSRREFLATSGGAAVLLAAGAGARTTEPWSPPIGACRGIDVSDVARQHGLTFLEVNSRGTFKPGQPDEAFAETRDRIANLRAPIEASNSLLPGSLPCTGPEADHGRVLAFTDDVFRRGSEVGVRVVTFGSGGARQIPDGFDRHEAELQFASLVGRMADRAQQFGIALCIEPLNARETNFLNRVDETSRLVRAVQHPNLGITADVFHMLREDEGPQSILDAANQIKHVHIAEAARTAVGVNGDDLRPYLRALREIGYDGRISFECRWGDFASELPHAVAALREQLVSLD